MSSKSIYVTFLPAQKRVKVALGTTIMQAAIRGRIGIRSRCNQQAGCLMCKVEVGDESAVFPKNEKEKRKLGDSKMRLACQTRIKASTTVTIPGDPLKNIVQAMLKQRRKEGDSL